MAKNDNKIKQLLNKVDEEEAKLGTKPKMSWNTNCLFRYDGDQQHFNLNTVNNTGYLVRALGFLLEKCAHQKEAANRLGVTDYKFDWKGYSLQDWEHDFKLKAELIAWQTQQNKLNALKKQLKELVSDEAKTEMALDEIEKILG